MTQPQVQLVDEPTQELVEALTRLLPQVSSRAAPLTAERVRIALQTPSTYVFVARVDDAIVGMALLLVHTTLAGQSGYVDEVAVDERSRGHRVGAALMHALLEQASRFQLDVVTLTSRPSRVAANKLYQSVGFTLKETNCYRFDVKDWPVTSH